MPEALFRFDVSPALGYGHMIRSSSLANALGRLGWNVAAAVNEDGVEYVRRLGTFARMLPLPGGCDEVTFLSDSVPQGCDLLVVDDYTWTAEVGRRVRGWAKCIAVVDDLPLRDHDADVLLCPSLGVEEVEFSGCIPRHCPVLIGASYVLMSPALVALRGRAAERRARPKPVERVLISMGGGKTAHALGVIIDSVCAALPDVRIDLVITGDAAAPDIAGAMNVHRNTPRLPELMLHADLAVGAAGVSALERSCLGLPSIVLQTADNQARQVATLGANGLARVLGTLDELNTDRLAGAIRELASNVPLRQDMARRCFAFIDGKGAERAAEAIDGIFHQRLAGATWARAHP